MSQPTPPVSPAPSPASAGTVLTWIMTHRKALVAYGGVVVMLLTLAFPHATWLPFVVSALTAFGVHVTPNAKL